MTKAVPDHLVTFPPANNLWHAVTEWKLASDTYERLGHEVRRLRAELETAEYNWVSKGRAEIHYRAEMKRLA